MRKRLLAPWPPAANQRVKCPSFAACAPVLRWPEARDGASRERSVLRGSAKTWRRDLPRQTDCISERHESQGHQSRASENRGERFAAGMVCARWRRSTLAGFLRCGGKSCRRQSRNADEDSISSIGTPMGETLEGPLSPRERCCQRGISVSLNSSGEQSLCGSSMRTNSLRMNDRLHSIHNRLIIED